ncbi:MAG: winged helix-turn-helix transcriptional regulator, partial [Nanobdellota archaeon]
HSQDLKFFFSEIYSRFEPHVKRKDYNLLTKTHLFNQCILPEYNMRIVVDHFTAGRIQLDDVDKAIISIISNKARIKLTDIGEQIGASPKVVCYHLKEMRRKGVILGSTLDLNLEALGYSRAQIELCIKNQARIPRIIEFFHKERVCIEAHELLGRYDLSIDIFWKEQHTYCELLRRFNNEFQDHYQEYNTMHVYKQYRPGWSIAYDLDKCRYLDHKPTEVEV